MLVGKDELKNAWQLTKVRLSNAKSGKLPIFAGIVGVIYLVSLILYFVWLRPGNGALESYQWQDYSLLFLGVLLITIFVFAANYRMSNRNYEVFPQTNTSRFLSSQACTYILIITCALALLLMYLIVYGITALLAAIFTVIHLVYAFDPLFVIAGFFVFIVWLSLFTAVVSLIAALIRRFKLYAILVFAVATGVLIARLGHVIELTRITLGFILFEQSVLLFLLKGIALWIVLFICAFLVNKFTVYYKDSIRLSAQRIAIVVLASALGFTTPTFFVTPDASLVIIDDRNGFEYSWEAEQIEIDVSALPNGTRITIEPGANVALIPSDSVAEIHYGGGTITVVYEDKTIEEYPDGYLLVYYPEELSSINGNKLVIIFNAARVVLNSYDLMALTHPTFEARLEGTRLYLDYHYDKNVKAVFLPIWSFMWQFEYFRDKGVVEQPFVQFSSNSSGAVSIWVE